MVCFLIRGKEPSLLLRRWRAARTDLGKGRRCRRGSPDPNRRFAQQTVDDGVAVLLLDQHELATTRIGTLNSEYHGNQGSGAKSRVARGLRQNLKDGQPAKPVGLAGDFFLGQAAGAMYLGAGHLATGHVQGHHVNQAVAADAATDLDRRARARFGARPSIQHSPILMQASAWWASPCNTLTRTRDWFSLTV